MLNVAIVHIILAIPALILASRNNISTHSQKGLQWLFTILLPILGPVITIIMVIYMNSKASPQKTSVGDSADDHFRKFGRWW